MKSKKINGPHIKDSDTTSKIMTRLLIALAPIVCFALFKNSFMAYFYSEISVFKAFIFLFNESIDETSILFGFAANT